MSAAAPVINLGAINVMICYIVFELFSLILKSSSCQVNVRNKIILHISTILKLRFFFKYRVHSSLQYSITC